MKWLFLKISQVLQENTCAGISFLKELHLQGCSFIKKEAPALVFSCEVCEIFKDHLLTKHLRVTTSEQLITTSKKFINEGVSDYSCKLAHMKVII